MKSHTCFYKAMNLAAYRLLIAELSAGDLPHVVNLIDADGTHQVGQFEDYWAALSFATSLCDVYDCRINVMWGMAQVMNRSARGAHH